MRNEEEMVRKERLMYERWRTTGDKYLEGYWRALAWVRGDPESVDSLPPLSSVNSKVGSWERVDKRNYHAIAWDKINELIMAVNQIQKKLSSAE